MMKERFWAGILVLVVLLMSLTACKTNSGDGKETRETIELDTSDGYYGRAFHGRCQLTVAHSKRWIKSPICL